MTGGEAGANELLDHHARQALDEAYPALERLRDEGVIAAVGVGMNEPKLPTQFVTDTDIDAVLIAGPPTPSGVRRLRRAAAAAAVQFVVRHPAVGTVLLGARSQAEAAENWSHTHAGLPDDLWTALDEVIKGADDVD